MARTYKRDSNGRFAGGGGGGGGGRPKAKAAPRGVNRLTRDNAGKITSVGGNGATARGGRIRTASGKLRATQTAQLKGGARAGVMKGAIKRNPGAGARLAGVKGKPGTVPLSQVKRYNALDRARRKQKENYSREMSRVTGSTDRRRAAAAEPRAALADRKTRRIESTMRRLSNSPNSPNVPVLPRAKKVGERITGRLSIYGRKTPTMRAARIGNTIPKPRRKPQKTVVAASKPKQSPRARVRSNATGLARKVGSDRRLYRRTQTATQPTLFGGKDRVMSGPKYIGTRRSGGGISPRRQSAGRLPAPGSPRAKRNRADSVAAYRDLGAAALFRKR